MADLKNRGVEMLKNQAAGRKERFKKVGHRKF